MMFVAYRVELLGRHLMESCQMPTGPKTYVRSTTPKFCSSLTSSRNEASVDPTFAFLTYLNCESSFANSAVSQDCDFVKCIFGSSAHGTLGKRDVAWERDAKHQARRICISRFKAPKKLFCNSSTTCSFLAVPVRNFGIVYS